MADLFFKWSILILAVKEGERRDTRIGHTLMQKLVYLLQSAVGVDVGYGYRLHHYGPYSEELWSDLTSLSDIDVLNVEPSPDGYGYLISLGDQKRARMFLQLEENLPKDEIEKLVDKLGSLASRNLELIATTHFVHANLQHRGRESGDFAIRAAVRNLKPHFSDLDVNSAIALLTKQGWY